MTFPILQYLRHLLTADRLQQANTPLLRPWKESVFKKNTEPQAVVIDQFRKELSSVDTFIEIEDLGAGYQEQHRPVIRKTLGEVVKSSARGRGEGELLLRMARLCQPRQLLELGTNLGFSTLYLATGSPAAEVITIEGAPALCALAQQHFDRFGIAPQLLHGEFSQVLQTQIDWTTFQPELVFIDGNHKEQATVEYAKFLATHISGKTVLIFDDIYWSRGMTRAWEQIKAMEVVSVSVDLYHLGICFLREDQPKQHLKFRIFP